MKLSQEAIDKESSLPKQQAKQQYQKNNQLFRRNNRLFIPANKYQKLNLKRLRIERLHTNVYTGSL